MFHRQTFEKYRTAEEERCKNYKFTGRRYFDHPDGEDLVGKLIATAKVTIATGLCVGLGRAASKPFTVKISEMVYRTIVPPIKLFVLGETFTVTTYYSTKFRKADDQVNYALGGMMTAGAAAAISKNTLHLLIGGPVLAFFATLYKDDLMQGKDKAIARQRLISPVWSKKLDWSLTQERKGHWTKEPLDE